MENIDPVRENLSDCQNSCLTKPCCDPNVCCGISCCSTGQACDKNTNKCFTSCSNPNDSCGSSCCNEHGTQNQSCCNSITCCNSDQTCNSDGTCSASCPPNESACGATPCCSASNCCNSTSCTTDSTSNRCCPDGKWVLNDACCSDNSCPNGLTCTNNSCIGKCPSSQLCNGGDCCPSGQTCGHDGKTCSGGCIPGEDYCSTGCCPSGQTCESDGKTCSGGCLPNQVRIESICCPSNSNQLCTDNSCCNNPPGCCGVTCCPSGTTCTTGNICCSSGVSVGQVCCASATMTNCGGSCCEKNHCNSSNTCCPSGQSACGSGCCDAGYCTTSGVEICCTIPISTDGTCIYPDCPLVGNLPITVDCNCYNGEGVNTTMCQSIGNDTVCNNFARIGDGHCYSLNQCYAYANGHVCCENENIIDPSTGACIHMCPPADDPNGSATLQCTEPTDQCLSGYGCCTPVSINESISNCCPYESSPYLDIKSYNIDPTKSQTQCCNIAPNTPAGPGIVALCPGASGTAYEDYSICCSALAPQNNLPQVSCAIAADGKPYCSGIGVDCSEYPCSSNGGLTCSNDLEGGTSQICCPGNYGNSKGYCIDVWQCVGEAAAKCWCTYPDCCVACSEGSIGPYNWRCLSRCGTDNAISPSCTQGEHCPLCQNGYC